MISPSRYGFFDYSDAIPELRKHRKFGYTSLLLYCIIAVTMLGIR